MKSSIQPTVETFYIPALDCSDELALIEKGLRRQIEVGRVTVNYVNRTLRIELDREAYNPAEVAAEIRRLGFEAEPVPRDAVPTVLDHVPHRLHTSTAIGGCLLLSAAVGWLLVDSMTVWIAALAITSTAASSYRVASSAWRAVRLRALDMNVLMTLAATGAIATANFFEAATAMFLFGISVWLEALSMGRARRAIRSLIELAPTVAHRVAKTDDPGNGNHRPLETVDPAVLALGDVVVVKPGERIPIDGTVLAGSSAVNQAPITGESAPVEKSEGDSVFAGTLNGEGSLRIETTREAKESTLVHIARLVEQAQATRSPTERFVDRFARRYTPAVILMAITMAVLPSIMAGEFDKEWFHSSLVLLVIACPCALVLSTPITIVCGLHQAARRGILIKGGEHLENAGRVDAMALDKTGTLTTGVAEVVDIEPQQGHSQEEVLRIAATLEIHSEHPLGRAIVAAAEARHIRSPEVSGFTALRGFGVRGDLEGRSCLVGAQRLLEQQGIETDSLEERAATAAWVAVDHQLIGVIWLADSLRDDAAAALCELKSLGISKFVVLTGDRAAVAQGIVEKLPSDLAIDVHADLLPDDKLEHVVQLTQAQPALAVVGDGVNDAPALAAARLGIALGSEASDTTLETADVVVMTAQLSRLPELVRLGRKCRRLLAQNIIFALSVKGIFLALAAAGWATMWMAVAADVGASLVVIANGMRMIGPPVATGDSSWRAATKGR